VLDFDHSHVRHSWSNLRPASQRRCSLVQAGRP
jgi:hypothetical protein